jgi:hypothetical protein
MTVWLPFLWYDRSLVGKRSPVRVPASDGGEMGVLLLKLVNGGSIRQSDGGSFAPRHHRRRASILYVDNTRLETAVCYQVHHTHRSCCSEEEFPVFSNALSV